MGIVVSMMVHGECGSRCFDLAVHSISIPVAVEPKKARMRQMRRTTTREVRWYGPMNIEYVGGSAGAQHLETPPH